jgi:hypothetical protein
MLKVIFLFIYPLNLGCWCEIRRGFARFGEGVNVSLRLAAKIYTSRGTLDSLSRPCWLSLKSPSYSVGVAKASIILANKMKF